MIKLLLIILLIFIISCQPPTEISDTNTEDLVPTVKSSVLASENGCDVTLEAVLCTTPACTEIRNCQDYCQPTCEENNMGYRIALHSLVDGNSFCSCTCNRC